MDRCVYRVHRDNSDGLLGLLVLVAGHISAAVIEGQLHCQLGVLHQSRYVQIGIENLHFGIAFDVAGGHLTGADCLDNCHLLAFGIKLGYYALDIEHYLGDILLDSGDGRELMLHAVDLNAGGRCAGQRGKQYAAQGITEGGAVPAL